MASKDPRAVLLAALIAKWAATTALQNGINGPWLGSERPADAQGNPASGTLYPYCLIPTEGSPLDRMTCASEFYRHDVTFRVYDLSPENCQTAVELVKSVFDSDTLSLTLVDGSVVSHRPTGGARYVQQDKTVWYGEFSYRFDTQRSRIA
jgi:hypothetical protein